MTAFYYKVHIPLSKSERERQVPHGIAYMWNLKYDPQELICETEIDAQTQKTDLWLGQGGVERPGEGWSGSLGSVDASYHYRMDGQQGPIVSSGNCIQYPIINYNGKEHRKKIYIYKTLCCIPEISTIV